MEIILSIKGNTQNILCKRIVKELNMCIHLYNKNLIEKIQFIKTSHIILKIHSYFKAQVQSKLKELTHKRIISTLQDINKIFLLNR